MTDAELSQLPIAEIAADNAMLFMWVTAPKVFDAEQIAKSWGFTYKTKGFCWIKTNQDGSIFKGLGHYVRGNSEDCLIFTRGKRLERSDRARGQTETRKPVKPDQSDAGLEQERGTNFHTDHRRQRGERFRPETISWEQALPWGESLGSIEDIERRSDIPQPLVCGMDDGLVHRMDRTRVLGNGQIPIVAAVAWLLLTEDLNNE